MIRLKRVIIHKYRCLADNLAFDVDDKITSIIGKNEIGKTSALEAIAKANYFDSSNERFKYDSIFDYPRRDYTCAEVNEESAVTLIYELPDNLIKEIEEYVRRPIIHKEFSIKVDYSGKKNLVDKDELIDEYVYKRFILPKLPSFLFYDTLSNLPSRVSVGRLINDDNLTDSERTAKALVMLAGLDLDSLSKATDFEIYKKQLEEAEAKISKEFLKYWSGNQDLQLELQLAQKELEQTKEKKKFLFWTSKKSEFDLENLHLEIRIHDRKNMISLPFEKRSMGFKWYFSFFIWFMAVQKENAANYIFLLDEPGINLHEEAQKDLLRLMDSISEKAQILFTTHSQFMCLDARNMNYALVDGQKGTEISTIDCSINELQQSC